MCEESAPTLMEDEDPSARKRRMANERKKKWLAKQDPESLNMVEFEKQKKW